MPAVHVGGGLLVKLRAGAGVALDRDLLPFDSAVELVKLLDTALDSECEHGPLGNVPLADGRRLYVRRWPTAVTIGTTAPGVTLTLVDNVAAARDAIAELARVDQQPECEPSSTPVEPDVELPERTRTVTRSRSLVAGRRR